MDQSKPTLQPVSQNATQLGMDVSASVEDGIYSQHTQYTDILQQVLPHLGTDEEKIIYAQVMLALKLEGVIGQELSNTDSEIVTY